MTRQRFERVHQVLAKRQPDLTVIMDGVHKPHNIAAIIRSCDAVGVMAVHLARPHDKRLRAGAPHATSGGSQKWVQQHQYDTAIPLIRQMQERGFQVLAANKSARANDFRQVDLTRPTAFLMGAELFGVSAEAQDCVDGEVFIPMAGMVESFNVSVACAILLAEAQRQRLAAGDYDKPKLPESELKRLAFEWLYPRLARMYRSNAKEYPALDDEGTIIAASGNNAALP